MTIKSDLNLPLNEGSIIAFVGGMILTMDPCMKNAEAVIVRDGRILDVGDKELVDSYPDAHIINLNGRAMLPAFIDSHNRLSFGCFLPIWADLQGLTTKDAILDAVSEHASRSHGKWVVGFPWSDVGDGGEPLTKRDLDIICPDRPVALIHGTFHKLLLNSVAMNMADVNHPIVDKTMSGAIQDENGDYTGVICEAGEISALEMALGVSTEEYAELIEKRARSLLSYGITSIQDPGVTPEAEKAYRSLHDQGRLPISVLMMPHGRSLLDNNVLARLDEVKYGDGDEILRIGPIKLFADGGISGSIANEGVIGGRVFSSGVPRHDFAQPLSEAIKRGFQVCVHSIGNKATDAVLDAFEMAAKLAPIGFELRPRIEHMFIMSDEQIARLSAMKGCASVQPFFFARVLPKKVPCFEGHKWFPIGDLVDAGVTVCTNSDDPGFGSLTCIDPIKGALIGAAMGDEQSPLYNPDQAISIEQWLWMYTAGAALAGGLESERGMLRKGLVADLVILNSTNPEDSPVVCETWKSGTMVYKKDMEPA
jgi:predicted amidohydrolase YtcJ